MGKLIVLEGTDGSGKATQCQALFEALSKEGLSPRKIEFPRYSERSSALIQMYLGGEFGSQPTDVNAYAASTFFSVDRYASYKQDWGKFYEDGGLVLADRYTTSNAVHQGSKLPPAEQEAYFRWLFDFEYRLLGLPEPDLVIYLDVPVDQTEKNMLHRQADTNTSGDIHETNTEYLRACRLAAGTAADRFGWRRIPCVENGVMRSIEDIHKEVYSAVKEIL
ncbi:MAG: deoxynucleoside kinase [Oscillospiraceae bacterium]|nr:deoxynucleoside kinase [Oscillospiraceae bacterium]